nr:dol-p-man:man(5)glcnac(2)-pp-dol alpha-1,3-mannosyltransferase [Quercus suber]
MSKLSEPLKAFINATHARPNTTPAPKQIVSIYENIASDARFKNVGMPAWLSASLYGLATSPNQGGNGVYAAELMREVGLKCIGFNGVRYLRHRHGIAGKSDADQRALSQKNINEVLKRGNGLWDSVYHPLTDKLTAKLGQSHPDLPVHIIESEYGALFSDPASPSDPRRPNVGRVLTSVIAVACLRAQTGVGPQVVSHVFGLRKAFEDGTAEPESEVEGGKWLASNEGSLWLLELVDRIVEAIGGERGSSFAQGFDKSAKAKLIDTSREALFLRSPSVTHRVKTSLSPLTPSQFYQVRTANMSAITNDDDTLNASAPVPGTVHLVDLMGTMATQHGKGTNRDIVLVPAPSADPDDPVSLMFGSEVRS